MAAGEEWRELADPTLLDKWEPPPDLADSVGGSEDVGATEDQDVDEGETPWASETSEEADEAASEGEPEQSAAEKLAALEREYAELRQRVGTPDDVRNVKSMTQRQINALQAQIAQQRAEAEDALLRMQFQVAHAQIAQLPPEQQKPAYDALVQRWYQIDAERREQSYQQRDAAYAQREVLEAAEADIKARKAIFVNACLSAGGDPSRLNLNSPQEAEESLRAEMQRVQRARGNAPRRPPATPVRGRAPAAKSLEDQWLTMSHSERDAIIERARSGRLKAEDLLVRPRS